MKLVRISESDDWIVDYDKERGMYRVSYFEGNHFVDEHWFDAYEEKEIKNVIRCKDCIYKRMSNQNLWCDIFDKIMPEDGYCCFGEEEV